MISGGEKPQFYGRRKGHKLRDGRRQLFEKRLPEIAITLPDEDSSATLAAPFTDPFSDIWLEVGFGAGEHLAHQAINHPEIGFIGCEPYINGVASLLSRIEADNLANIRLFNDDARLLLGHLPTESLGRVFILFSDPWPKRRHNRRRFFNRENLDALSPLMKDGAVLRFASDDMNYIRWALDVVYRHPNFAWRVTGPEDWRRRPEDACQTRYEAKALSQGKKSVYLTFTRRPRD